MSIKFLHGDCLQLMKDIPNNSIDLIICDLPYGCLTSQTYKGVVDKSGSDLGKTYGEKITWDIKIDLDKFWTEARRILRNEHSPVIHFCTTKFGYELIKSNPDWFRYDIVWDKQRGVSFLSANKMPMRSHEMIYVFSAKGAFYNRVDIAGDFPKWLCGKNGLRTGNHADRGLPRTNITGGEGKRCVLSVINGINKYTNDRINKHHPTQKPIELYQWLIERYSPPNGTVLDPTFGSGNSCFAAQSLGRHAIGFEKDKTFYDIASQKIIPKNTID